IKKLFNEFELYIGALLFIILTIILTLQVILRYVFSSSISWIGELSTILFIFMTYLGISAASLKGQNLKVDFLIEKIKNTTFKKWTIFYTDFITLAFCVIVIFPLVKLVRNFHSSGSKTLLLQIPNSFIYSVLIFCLILTSIRLIQNSIQVFKSDNLNGNHEIHDNFKE